MSDLIVRRLQGILLLLGITGVTGLLLFLAYLPIDEARTSLREAQSQVERFRQELSQESGTTAVDVSELIRPTAASAVALQIQRVLVDLSAAAGLAQQELRALPEEELTRDIIRLSFGLVMTGDLGQWTEFMQQLSRQKPALLVDRVTMLAGPDHRGDFSMRIEMRLSAYAREPRRE